MGTIVRKEASNNRNRMATQITPIPRCIPEVLTMHSSADQGITIMTNELIPTLNGRRKTRA
jgi:hypothetical protein